MADDIHFIGLLRQKLNPQPDTFTVSFEDGVTGVVVPSSEQNLELNAEAICTTTTGEVRTTTSLKAAKLPCTMDT